MAQSTVLDLLDNAVANSPDAPLAVSTQATTSYRQVQASAQNVARHLLTQTQKPVVALFFPMSAEFLIAYYGVLYAGKQALPLNLLLSPEELKLILQDSGAEAIIAPPLFAARLAPLGLRVIDFASLCAPAQPAALPRPKAEDVCTLLYTSGTTGVPKGVELSHGNLAANALSAVQTMHLDSDHRFLACLPSFHTFAITATMLAPITAGASFVAMPKFDPEGVLKLSSELKCNLWLMVPSMYRLVTRMQERKPLPIKLRLAIAGGEALPSDTREAFERVFGVPLLEGYGQTETGPVISFNTPEAHKPGTVGRTLKDVQVRIVDPESLRDLPAETTGEIWVRGPSIMRGYHNKSEETSKVLTPEGWLRTGDMGELTTDGYVRITGRLREMVKVAGEMVFPAEVENALLQHPAILEAGVAGHKDPRKGEIVKAYVVLKPGATAGEVDVLAHCRQVLAPYKVPRAIEFRSELPKGPTGKVLRRFLK